MKDAIYRISLDIHEHGSQAVLKAKKTDTGRKLHITLREGGTPYIIADDCYAVFKATKPDGSILYNACTIENNEIIYEFTEQTCTAVGRCRCEIALYGLDNKLITSPRFMLLVDGTIYPDGVVESTDEFSALTDLVGDTLKVINDATEAAESANESAVSANNATSNANQAAESASQAATAATQATQNANTATGNANTATKNANEATNRANEATQAANNATSSVSQATERANDATNNATLAADNANKAATKAAHTAKSLMVIGGADGTAIHMDDAADQVLVDLRVFGKTVQDGTPTPDAPVELVSVGDSGAIKTTVCGVNLVPGLIEGKTYTRNGLTLNVYADRCVCSGTPTSAYTQVYITSIKNTLSKGVYRVSGGQNGDGQVYLQVIVERGGKTTYFVEDKTFQIYGDEDDVRVTIQTGPSIAAVTDYVFYPIIHVGSTPIPYEPYKSQTLTASTPNGLPGIPVTSGGNYTDADGQQWLCDEIDFYRGVYLHRVCKKTFDGTENWLFSADSYYVIDHSELGSANTRNPLCSHFAKGGEGHGHFFSGTVGFAFFHTATTLNEWKAFLSQQFANGTPVEMIYALKTPTETSLTEEELAAYDALHTYRDNATVSNDAMAYMELEYVMDAKKYIDSLITGGIVPATVE